MVDFIKRLTNSSKVQTYSRWGDLDKLFPEAASLLSKKPVDYEKVRHCIDTFLSRQLDRIQKLGETDFVKTNNQELAMAAAELVAIDTALDRVLLFCALMQNIQENRHGVQRAIPLFNKAQRVTEMVGKAGLDLHQKLDEVCSGRGGDLLQDKNVALILGLKKYWQKFENPLNSDPYAEALDKLERVTRQQGKESFSYLDNKHKKLLAEGLAGLFQYRLDAIKRSGFDNITDAFLDGNKLEKEIFESFMVAAEEAMPRLAMVSKNIGNVPSFVAPMRYSWQEAREIVTAAYRECHPEIGEAVAKAFDEKWIYAVSKGIKISQVIPGLHPETAEAAHPYMALNFDGSLRGLQDLAHEMGHVVHRHFSNSQPLLNTPVSNVLNEIPAFVGEQLVREYLLKHVKTPQEKLAVQSVFDGKHVQSLAAAIPSIGMEQEFYDHVSKNGTNDMTYEQFDAICGKHVKLNGRALPLQNLRLEYLKLDYLARARHPLAQVLAFSMDERIRSDENFGENFLQLMKAGGTITPKQAWEKLLGEVPSNRHEFWREKFSQCTERIANLSKEIRQVALENGITREKLFTSETPDYVAALEVPSRMARHGREFL